MKNDDIANMLGIHPVSLSRLRNGHRKPSLDMIAKIDSLLGWSMTQQLKAYRHKDPLKYGEAFRKHLKDTYDIPDPKEEPDDSATTPPPKKEEPDAFAKKPGVPYLGVVFGDARDD